MPLTKEQLTDIISEAYKCPISYSIQIDDLRFYNGGHSVSTYFSSALLQLMRTSPGVKIQHPISPNEDLRLVANVMRKEDYWAKTAFLIFAKHQLLRIEDLNYGQLGESNLSIAAQKLAELASPEQWSTLPHYYEKILPTAAYEFGNVSGLFLQPYIPASGPNTFENRVIALPVVASDGATYDLATFVNALEKNWASPITGQPLQRESARINRAMSTLLTAYLASDDPAKICPDAKKITQTIQQKITQLYSDKQINDYIARLNRLMRHDDDQCTHCQTQKKNEKFAVNCGGICIFCAPLVLLPVVLASIVFERFETSSASYPDFRDYALAPNTSFYLAMSAIGCLFFGLLLSASVGHGTDPSHKIHHKGLVPNIGWQGAAATTEQPTPSSILKSILIAHTVVQSGVGLVTVQPRSQ
ncbi:MAG: hypothetical protein EXR81_03885 [Gammaproteobacteria bacterium]|nr:hypothetical protein [Gammaproteobacteria bacterium]